VTEGRRLGNLSRPLPPLLKTKNPTILALARAAYDNRLLPAGTLEAGRLADAIEAAGYTDDDLLRHLRSTGPHVRGCHAVDAILGRAD
jgi:hypothetical protein